jgi:hypothetical protein
MSMTRGTINWVAEIESNAAVAADWNGEARLSDFFPVYEKWNFRVAPPNIIVDTVEKMSGGKPFARIEDVIAPAELRKLFENYQKIAGYHVDMVGKR